MNETINRLMTAKANYERSLIDYEHAPHGNPLIDNDIAETLAQAKAEYKAQLVEAIHSLATELSEME